MGAVNTVFAPAPGRPAGYPSDLPFVTDHAVAVTEMPDSEKSPSAQWSGVAEPRVVVDQLRQQSIDQGWTLAETPDAAPAGFPMEMVSLTREGSTRVLVTVYFGKEGTVQLVEIA